MIIFGLMRIKNVVKYMPRLMDQMSKIVDGVLILDDGSTDGTGEACDASKDKFKQYFRFFQNKPYHGGRDWNFLHDQVKQFNPDFIVWLDGDELFEEGKEQDIRKLIESSTPETRAYSFPFFYHWNDEQHYRIDGNYSRVNAVRAYRYNFEWRPRDVIAHSNPVSPEVIGCDVLKNSCVRIHHFGYMDEIDRINKYEFYTKRDPDPLKAGAGSKDYNHIISPEGLKVKEWDKYPVSVCLVSYNRPESLKTTLNDIIDRNSDYYRMTIVDNASDEATKNVLRDFESKNYGINVWYENDCHGPAQNFNKAFKCSYGKYLVHIESDITVDKNDWINEMAKVMDEHPEIGILAPDKPGHHLRLDRGIFDEVDFCMGGIWMTRREIFDKLGGWDEALFSGNLEVDYCYKVRLCGYRVGLLKGMTWTHLDDEHIKTLSEEQMDKRKEPFNRGAFEFLKKWNLFYLGYFHYKSPLMMFWDDFPLNQMFRKQLFAQLQLNKETEKITVQDHNCEIVRNIVALGTNREKDVVDLVRDNRVLGGVDNFLDMDPELLSGKKKWSIEEDYKMDKKRKQ